MLIGSTVVWQQDKTSLPIGHEVFFWGKPRVVDSPTSTAAGLLSVSQPGFPLTEWQNWLNSHPALPVNR